MEGIPEFAALSYVTAVHTWLTCTAIAYVLSAWILARMLPGIESRIALWLLVALNPAFWSSPASRARPSASRTWSPASTTPAGPPSTSGSASPPSPPWPGRPNGSCAASCRPRPPSSGSTPAPACPWSSGPSPAGSGGRGRALGPGLRRAVPRTRPACGSLRRRRSAGPAPRAAVGGPR